MVEHWWEWPLLIGACILVWLEALWCLITGKDFTDGWG